jgi:putative endonuclease
LGFVISAYSQQFCVLTTRLRRTTLQDMTAPHLERGAAAELLAAAYLESHGLAIVARNVRCRLGEIDLVCRDGATLVIVEVRQRASRDFGGALGSVTWRKQRRIIRATQYFWQRHADWRRLALRFDVLAICGAPDGSHDIEWVKDAFRTT